MRARKTPCTRQGANPFANARGNEQKAESPNRYGDDSRLHFDLAQASNSSARVARRRFGGPGWPPVHRAQIRGEWWITKDLIWPAVVWNETRCWAYLHDLTPDTLQWVMDCLRQAEIDRHSPGMIRWGA